MLSHGAAREETSRDVGGETLAQVAQRGGRCPSPGITPGQVGWGSEQLDPVDVPAHGRGSVSDGYLGHPGGHQLSSALGGEPTSAPQFCGCFSLPISLGSGGWCARPAAGAGPVGLGASCRPRGAGGFVQT